MSKRKETMGILAAVCISALLFGSLYIMSGSETTSAKSEPAKATHSEPSEKDTPKEVAETPDSGLMYDVGEYVEGLYDTKYGGIIAEVPYKTMIFIVKGEPLYYSVNDADYEFVKIKVAGKNISVKVGIKDRPNSVIIKHEDK